LREELLPLAALVTPNLPEAEALTGLPARTRREREQVARYLVEMGARAALIKGGHGEGEMVEDLLFDGRELSVFQAARLRTTRTHGTGCTLSAAIATGLGQGQSLAAAVARAMRYVQAAIRLAPRLGKGQGPLSHAAGQAPWI
jgi:hydroxymethylpyrimidine/phosphomethylpyrimidine kinase